MVGAPLVLRLNPNTNSVRVRKGEQADLSLVVCADPRPRHVSWEWGSMRLDAGNSFGKFRRCVFFEFMIILLIFPKDRYRVDDVSQDSREDCYLAALHISETDTHDSRPYYLLVENDRGSDRHAVQLIVEGTFTGAFKNHFFSLFIYTNLLNKLP